MKKKAFTLVEILVAVIVLGILASLSISTFQKTIGAHKDRMCQENLNVLQAAIEVYEIENDSLPDSLAKLEPRHIHLAYLKAAGAQKDNKLLAFLKDISGIKSVLAETLPSKYYGNNKKVLRCPADASASTDPDYTSYHVNTAITDLGDSDTEEQALVADKKLYHKKGQVDYGNAVNQYGELGNIDKAESFDIVELTPILGPTTTSTTTSTGSTIPTVNKANCCVGKRSAWRNLNKKFGKGFRKACSNAGYKSPKKNGTPRGWCKDVSED